MRLAIKGLIDDFKVFLAVEEQYKKQLLIFSLGCDVGCLVVLWAEIKINNFELYR